MWLPEWQATISATIQMLDLISKAKTAAMISTQEVITQDAGQITPMPPQETGIEAERCLIVKKKSL